MLDKSSWKRFWIILILLLTGFSCRAFPADATITVSGTETLLPAGWDGGNITISFSDSIGRIYSQTISYGQYSTADSIASAFGAQFSNAYYPSGLLCAHAVGTVIYLHLIGAAAFETPNISNPSTSFSLVPSLAWPHLMISSIAPNAASVGDKVTIVGSSFGATQGSSTVSFNGVLASTLNWNNTSIVAEVPAGATTGNVVVTVSGMASNGVAFTVRETPGPTVVSVSPTSGYVGLVVNVSGTGFGATEDQGSITFNGISAGVLSWSDSSITTVVPGGVTTGPVIVTVANGQTSNSNVNFTVMGSSCSQ